MVGLSLEGLGARYGRTLVLSGVDTGHLAGGTLTAVIGPNAAGKSTLFKRIAGLAKGPGIVHLTDTQKGPETICYMPQDTGGTAALTVYESVLLATKQGSGWRVGDDELGLIDDILADLGIDELAFRGLSELSGGQRQLVSIAQALARRPEVLLMDEPTSALDLFRQIRVLTFMQARARQSGMAVLIALHDLNHALRYCSHTMVIADGTLVAGGPTADVITREMLAGIYKVKARVERCSQGRPVIIVDGALA